MVANKGAYRRSVGDSVQCREVHINLSSFNMNLGAGGSSERFSSTRF